METKYFAYCRESVKGLESGIEIQKEQIEKYAKAYDLKISTWYIDNGISAYKFRPKFEKMMQDIDQAKGIICADLTRFGRNTMDLLYNINVLNDKNKELIFIREQWNTATKEGKMFLTFMAAIADYERAKINERMSAGKEYARTHGTKSGKQMHRPGIDINWIVFDELEASGAIKISNEDKDIQYRTEELRYLKDLELQFTKKPNSTVIKSNRHRLFRITTF